MDKKNKKPLAIIILDGFGIKKQQEHNAIAQAKTPWFDYVEQNYFSTTLEASGPAVGLLPNEQGNSEVGHFTIGAGTIVTQTATKLHHAFTTTELLKNATLLSCIETYRPPIIHLIGLISDGGIHGHIDHLIAMIEALHILQPNSTIAVHAITDGRDCAPKSAVTHLLRVQETLEKLSCGYLATIGGRFYAMDRDNNQDRTDRTIEVFTTPSTTICSPEAYLEEQYAQGITDEFIAPQATSQNHIIKPDSFIIFTNFRSDRAIQLAKALLEQTKPACFITPVLYHESIKTTPLLAPIKQEHTLLERLNAHGYRIFTCAETEKFAHVTYFFNGYKDITLNNETRQLVPSIKTTSYASCPQMSAPEITAAILAAVDKDIYDIFLINYANADMVGHTGNLPATIAAIECLNDQLSKLYNRIVTDLDGKMLITADHGNAEVMFDEQTDQPCTSHTTSKVPLFFISKQPITLPENLMGLSDIYQLVLANAPKK